MKRLSALSAIPALLAALALPALAQTVDGEVKKIDRAQGKITLKHGEIAALEMPAMTMAYRVADPHLLDGLTEGAKVRFDAAKVNGQYTVTRLVPAR